MLKNSVAHIENVLGKIADLNEREFQFIRNRYDTDGSIKSSVEEVASVMSISAKNVAKYSIQIKLKFGIDKPQRCKDYKDYESIIGNRKLRIGQFREYKIIR